MRPNYSLKRTAGVDTAFPVAFAAAAAQLKRQVSFFQPPSKPLPPGYPLPRLDAYGTALKSGMPVRILTIPDWLTHDLPPEEAATLKAVEGTEMSILEIDAYGMLWFGTDEPWFSLRPFDVQVLQSRRKNVT